MKVKLFKRAGTENWQIKFPHPVTGRPVRQTTGTADDDEAEKIKQAKERELTSTDERDFSVIAGKYMDYAINIKELKPLTIRTQLNRIKVIKPYFSGMLITRIDTPIILDVLVLLIKTRGISKATANRYIALLSAIFEYAKLYKYIKENPVREIKYFKENKGRNAIIPIFSKFEIRLLFEAASDNFRPIIKFALYTGARLGEICGLKWEDTDFKNDLIHIKRSYDTTTKSGEFRIIPMHPELKAELRGWWSDAPLSDYVFPSTHPSHIGEMRTAGFKTAWRATIRRAGIEYKEFKSLRHTVVTDFLNTSGNTESQAMEIFGWKSQAMVQRYKQMSQRMEELKNAIGRMGY